MPELLTLLAPLSGVLVRLDDVPDAVFAQRMAGDGISLDPVSQELLAPCDGVVTQVHRAGHALTMSAAGLEIVIHIGLDTVNLKGAGFKPHVQAGAQVRTGQTLISFDADMVAQQARSLLTQMLITNMERVALLTPHRGSVRAGRDVVLEVTPKDISGGAVRAAEGDAVHSDWITIGSETGLHARPAALVAATARKFTADIRLTKDHHEANARSVVSIMALEVGGGDQVRVSARGPDAAEAIAAVAHTLSLDIQQTHLAMAPAQPAAPATAPGAASSDAHVFRGVAASPGAAVGTVFQLRHEDAVLEERAADPHQERRQLDAALASAHAQLEALQIRLAAEADPERAAIFAAHQELLEDPELLDAAAQLIRSGAAAAYAWQQSYSSQVQRLLALRSELLAGRAADLRDVGRRVLHLLTGYEATALELPAGSIVVAEDLVPSEAASLDRARVRGIATTMGSATSHVAILARALGIAAVAGVDPRVLELANGTPVLIDGDAGLVKPRPSAAETSAINVRQEASARLRAAQSEVATQPAVTRDGHRVEVVANIGDVEEAGRVVATGGEGVGLLRTEFLFLERQFAPDEAEQTSVYEAIAHALGRDRILVIRTLDVGGDKPLSYLPMAVEANPFLGERGIRLLLNRPDVLRTQIRAILRASNAGRIAIMFPMIATMKEWQTVRALVETERAQLGVPAIQIGIMVETPAAALLADRFAQDADFLSIGTNDLTQYTLAMDRTNPQMAAQLDALDPAVLRLIERTVSGAHQHGRWVGVCGALASDPQAIPILLGLEVDELSVSLPAIPAIKARVRELSREECRQTAREALNSGDADTVRELVNRRHGEHR